MRDHSRAPSFLVTSWPRLLLVVGALLALSLGACGPPRLNNPEPSPPSDDDDDDDDDTGQDDPCCEAGDEDTWRNCVEEDLAVDCVCLIDSFCCSNFWDAECASSYISPCGALTCGS